MFSNRLIADRSAALHTKTMSYRTRIVEDELALSLRATGAVLVEGAKACGKTATAMQVAASEARLDVDINARRMVEVDPRTVLAGETPRLIDEWQLAPTIWNHVRREVDQRGSPGQFILTGSAVPADDISRHTGAGRRDCGCGPYPSSSLDARREASLWGGSSKARRRRRRIAR